MLILTLNHSYSYLIPLFICFDASPPITDNVQEASVIGVLTKSQRIQPLVEAVLTQINLKADLFHKFVVILREEHSTLAQSIQQYHSELNTYNIIGCRIMYFLGNR